MKRLIGCIGLIAALALGAVSSAGCASPPIPNNGAANGQDASGKSIAGNPKLTYQSAGNLGDAANSEFGYSRQDTGTQMAPQNALNLQPADGGGTASYPNLTTLVYAPMTYMANAQRDSTLSSDQLKELAGIVDKGGTQLQALVNAIGKPSAETLIANVSKAAADAKAASDAKAAQAKAAEDEAKRKAAEAEKPK